MEDTNFDAKKLQEKLFNPKQNGWKGISQDEKQNIFNFCDGYINFLNNGKTEREIVK